MRLEAWRPPINDEEWGTLREGSKTTSRKIRETGNSSVSWGKKQPQCQHAGQFKYNRALSAIDFRYKEFMEFRVLEAESKIELGMNDSEGGRENGKLSQEIWL